MTGQDPIAQLPWLVARASGVLALVLVTCSVLLGLLTAGRVVRRRGWPRALTALHEQLALAGLVAIAGHGLALVADRWLHPGIAGITVPFLMPYRRAFTGLGVVAGYLAAVLALSFYARRRIGPRRWRAAHRATIVVYVLALAHTIGAGTDATRPWLGAFMLATAPLVAGLFMHRVLAERRRVRETRQRRPAPVVRAGRPAGAVGRAR